MAPGRGRCCPDCGNLSEHTPIGAAMCALQSAHRADLAGRADELGVKPFPVLDLYAHLCAVCASSQAYAATRYVLDLGWRKTIGEPA